MTPFSVIFAINSLLKLNHIDLEKKNTNQPQSKSRFVHVSWSKYNKHQWSIWIMSKHVKVCWLLHMHCSNSIFFFSSKQVVIIRVVNSCTPGAMVTGVNKLLLCGISLWIKKLDFVLNSDNQNLVLLFLRSTIFQFCTLVYQIDVYARLFPGKFVS